MLRSTIQTLRRLPPQLQALFVTTLIFRAGTMAFPFLSAYLIGNGGLSAGEAGAIVGAYGVGALLADLAAGPLLRLAGGHTVMVAGLISNGVLVAVMPFLEGAFLLLVATVVWGFCYETFTPASYTTIVQNCDESIRKVAFSAHRLAINLGMAVGPAVGGLLYAVQPTLLFWVNAVVVLAAAGFLLSRRFESAPTTSAPPARPGRLVSSTWRGESRFWTFFVLSLPIHVAFALPPVFLSAFVVIERELSSNWVNIRVQRRTHRPSEVPQHSHAHDEPQRESVTLRADRRRFRVDGTDAMGWAGRRRRLVRRRDDRVPGPDALRRRHLRTGDRRPQHGALLGRVNVD